MSAFPINVFSTADPLAPRPNQILQAIAITDASYSPGSADEIFTPHDEAEPLLILARASRERIPVIFVSALTRVTANKNSRVL